jgi:hypothetical protein
MKKPKHLNEEIQKCHPNPTLIKPIFAGLSYEEK